MEATAAAASIDLRDRHFVFHRAEITMIGTWLRVNGRTRPCIALVRRGEEYSELCRPYIITIDRAVMWSEDLGDPMYQGQQMFQVCECLRMPVTPQNFGKIIGFINDYLGDFLSVPPYPVSAAPARQIADVTIKNLATGAETEVVITDV